MDRSWPSDAVILNLGCGTRTSERTINIDWSPAVRLRSSRWGQLPAMVFIRGSRREAYERMVGTLIAHDLRKGIPAPDASVDAVYHSHVLEHIDRDEAGGFLDEILRVLRPGGIVRIVVPDFEFEVRKYLASLERESSDHDESLVPLLAQSVQREAYGTSLQGPVRRRLENLLLGDARKRGQTHQWMYDELNLRQLLERHGYVDVRRQTEIASAIPDWASFELDTFPDGRPYKPGSLYMEGRRPNT